MELKARERRVGVLPGRWKSLVGARSTWVFTGDGPKPRDVRRGARDGKVDIVVGVCMTC